MRLLGGHRVRDQLEGGKMFGAQLLMPLSLLFRESGHETVVGVLRRERRFGRRPQASLEKRIVGARARSRWPRDLLAEGRYRGVRLRGFGALDDLHCPGPLELGEVGPEARGADEAVAAPVPPCCSDRPVLFG